MRLFALCEYDYGFYSHSFIPFRALGIDVDVRQSKNALHDQVIPSADCEKHTMWQRSLRDMKHQEEQRFGVLPAF
jgi:hypothetical protein